MNKKIKVIDLINLIANKEEIPKKIKIKGNIFEWKVAEDGIGYYNTEEYKGYDWLENYISLDDCGDLNTVVEILEDNTEEIDIQDIEEIQFPDNTNLRDTRDLIINQLVKAVKKLDKDINYIDN